MKGNTILFHRLFLVALMVNFSFSALVGQQKNKPKNLPVSIKRDTSSKEYWRNLGHQAKINGQFYTALENYKKVLSIDVNDYDALLATARLYFKLNNHERALEQYVIIFKKDTADVEALNGMGECYFELKKNDEAIYYFKKAISYLPGYVPLYLNLAKIYLIQNDLEQAKKMYETSLEYDKTYAEVWAGIGKILYWQNKPKSAITYYLKAKELDPSDEKIQAEYKLIHTELAFSLTAGLTRQKEAEEVYDILAIFHRYEINKRVNNYLFFSANTLFDHSKKITPEKDTVRNFDNTQLTTSILLGQHRLSLFLGASVSDSRLTAYGINWLSHYTISNVKIKNNFLAGYDYFYYWKEVDQDYYSNSMQISLYKFNLHLGFKRGVVRENYIWDYETIDINPYITYTTGLNYVFLRNPKITFGFNHSYVNYTAHSLLYYSPYRRSINGISLSSLYLYRKFNFYSGVTVKRDNYKNNIWSAELEAGYNFDKLNISAGWGNYNDPFYKNSRFYLVLKNFF